MAANTSPIFSRTPNTAWVNGITAANTAKDGTGTVDTVFTADAVEGSFLQKLIVRPRGTNVATVVRVFLNNGSTNATAANNVLIDEIPLTATTNTENAAIQGNERTYNIPIDPGYKINIALGTAVAGGISITAIGGDY